MRPTELVMVVRLDPESGQEWVPESRDYIKGKGVRSTEGSLRGTPDPFGVPSNLSKWVTTERHTESPRVSTFYLYFFVGTEDLRAADDPSGSPVGSVPRIRDSVRVHGRADSIGPTVGTLRDPFLLDPCKTPHLVLPSQCTFSVLVGFVSPTSSSLRGWITVFILVKYHF